MSPEAERGSAPVEFLLSSTVLLVLVLGVLQVGAILLVRNTALDAAAEGARWAAVEGNSEADGAERARRILTDSLGAGYARSIRVARTTFASQPAVAVTVRIPLPVIGLLGPADGIEVTGHAALEPAA